MVPQGIPWAICSVIFCGTVLCSSMVGAADKPTAAVGKAAGEVDRALPDFKPTEKLQGSIKSICANNLWNVMSLWGEGFKKHYPNVVIENESPRATTVPYALIAEAGRFGSMLREFKPVELEGFQKKFGHKPTTLVASYDVLAVYVHKDNPIESLTLAQLDAIFSGTRKRGGAAEIRTWGQLGLKGEWAEREIVCHSRNAATASYGFFRERALSWGDYKDNVKEHVGSTGPIRAVAGDKRRDHLRGHWLYTGGCSNRCPSSRAREKANRCDGRVRQQR
jgi:phosphate transport system substrate-binding protein